MMPSIFWSGWWTDAGTFESLLRAANLVSQSVTARAAARRMRKNWPPKKVVR